MPATRSRNENWRHSLQQLHAKGGSLEIALPHALADAAVCDHSTPDGASHVVWRVRVLDLSSDEILVEQPVALGRVIPIAPQSKLIAVIAIGQNRWMFRTTHLGTAAARNAFPAIRLQMPNEVERCQRRKFYRVATIGLDLPKVRCSPLLDLDSAALAESANRAELHALEDRGVVARIGPNETRSFDQRDSAVAIAPAPVMPIVGPSFDAALMNLGGGGVGLVVERNDRAALEAARHLWLQVDLRPHLPAPIGVTARLRHTHIDSSQRVYAGLSFEFAHSPRHERFIVDQLCRYVVAVQHAQAALTPPPV